MRHITSRVGAAKRPSCASPPNHEEHKCARSDQNSVTDLKSGYLLGAHPRKQFLAQFAGIFVGTAVTVLSFQVMVPTAEVLGSEQFPAPAAQTWRAGRALPSSSSSPQSRQTMNNSGAVALICAQVAATDFSNAYATSGLQMSEWPLMILSAFRLKMEPALKS